MSEPLLTTDSVSLAYFDGDQTTYALKEVSIELNRREFVGIMGPSGSGKSSLLYMLSGLKRPTSGEISFSGKNYSGLTDAALTDLRRLHFGFVFQQPWLLGWQTTLENVIMGSPKIDRSVVKKAEGHFERLNISPFRNKFPSQLSGGEKQRVCVARAMMNDPEVIFADEPTASLDQRNGHLVIDLIAAYREQGTVVIVTHDAAMLSQADRILVMRDGQAIEWVTPSEAQAGKSIAVSGLRDSH